MVESEVCTHRYFELGSLSQVARADWVADEVIERVTSVADWARRERANMAGERDGDGARGRVVGECSSLVKPDASPEVSLQVLKRGSCC